MSSDNEPHSNQQTQILNPNENNNRRQRKRSVFDLEQVRQLEYVFNQITHYPDLPLRQQLTLLTELPDKKVQVCFMSTLICFSLTFFISSDLVSKSSCQMEKTTSIGTFWWSAWISSRWPIDDCSSTEIEFYSLITVIDSSECNCTNLTCFSVFSLFRMHRFNNSNNWVICFIWHFKQQWSQNRVVIAKEDTQSIISRDFIE